MKRRSARKRQWSTYMLATRCDTFRALMKQVDNDEKHEMIGNGIIMGCNCKIKLENNAPMPSLMAKFTIASDGDKYPSRREV